MTTERNRIEILDKKEPEPKSLDDNWGCSIGLGGKLPSIIALWWKNKEGNKKFYGWMGAKRNRSDSGETSNKNG